MAPETQSASSLPPEVLQQIRRIQIRTSYLVNDVFAGEYETAFRGRGMEFEEVREYVPGDDVRFIDWNVTARTGRPFVKVFREERELTVMLLVDVSSSGQFGTVRSFKSEVSAEIAAVLAYAAVRTNDKAGLVIFSDTVEHFVPPRKGPAHVWRLIREVLSHRARGRGTDLVAALEFLNRVIRHKAICFIISDFILEDYEKTLRRLNRKFDLVALRLIDPREERIPRLGLVEFEDAETGEVVLVDTADLGFQRRFLALSHENEEKAKMGFRLSRVDQVLVRTDQPYIESLVSFFRMREKREMRRPPRRVRPWIPLALLVPLVVLALAAGACHRGRPPVDSAKTVGENAEPGSEAGQPAAYSRVEGKGGAEGEGPPVVFEAMLDKTRLTPGEILTLTISVDRTAGTQIKLPEFQRYGRLEVLSVVESESPGTAGRVVLIRTYKLQGFVVGAYRLPGIPVRYTDSQGRWRQTRTERFYLWVASVIPPGEEPEDILDLKPLFVFVWKLLEAVFWLILGGGCLVLLAGIVTYGVFRRRRRTRVSAGPKLAHDFALEELERLLKEGLIARGLIGRHYVVLHRIIRRYLERRFGLGCMERTSEEILAGLRGMRYFGQHTYDVADRFFSDADQVKFAACVPSSLEIDETLKSVYYFIELTRERAAATPAGVTEAEAQAAS